MYTYDDRSSHESRRTGILGNSTGHVHRITEPDQNKLVKCAEYSDM